MQKVPSKNPGKPDRHAKAKRDENRARPNPKYSNPDYTKPKIGKSKWYGPMRNLLRDFDWMFSMEWYWESQDAISVLVELLIKDNRPDEAWSVLQHTEYTYPQPQFKDILEWGKKNKTLPNILWSQDFFGPLGWKIPNIPTADLCKLSDYGIKSKDVIMVPGDPNHTVESAIAIL
jgi:hypothetical protein